MRVLVVGEMHERSNVHFFYSSARKLINGLIRNGCCVVSFNDREMARMATKLHNKALGRPGMNRQLLKTVENFVPDLIVLCHADLVDPSTLAKICTMSHKPKIIMQCVDALFQPKTIIGIERFADLSDAIFITSAGESIKRLSGPGRVVSFIPNAVDKSMESFRAFDNLMLDYDVFFASRYARSMDRINFAQDLRKRMPDVRFDFRGFDGKESIFGVQFGEALSRCRMGLSLDKENGWYLYASSRMSEYMGNGLLTFVHRSSKFDEIFSEDELGLYADLDELEKKIRHFKSDDAAAREVARRGHARVHEYFDTTRVARYILDVTFERGLSENYPWPTDLM